MTGALELAKDLPHREFANETKFQEACNKYLRDKNIVYTHRQKGRVNKPTSQNFIILNGVKMKYPDLDIKFNGNCFYIELKMIGEKLKAEQENFRIHQTDAGFSFDVCRTWAEFIMVMRAKGIEKTAQNIV